MSLFIIAEAGINHNGDIGIAKQLIDVAAEAGADAVKFQKRNIDKVYTQEFLESARESPWGKTQRAQKQGIEFASAWDLDSQKFLQKFELEYNKIASPMVVSQELLSEVASEGRHTFISTGM